MEQTNPSKPLSAYGLFFRDTVNAIKQQNPTSSFQELSKIVASMWDVLDPVHKEVYVKKSEMAMKEYWEKVKQKLKTNTSETLQQTDGNDKQQTMTQQVDNNLADKSTTTTQGEQQHAPQSDHQVVGLTAEGDSLQICIRKNCNKPAIRSPDWEDEYCSNECVVIHCREVFDYWVRSNLDSNQE